MTGRRIEVVDYESTWPEQFNIEKQQLAEVFDDEAVRFEHIGSTSVPGLPAKPIIDILIEVTDVSLLDSKSSSFEQLGYEVKGENGIAKSKSGKSQSSRFKTNAIK